MREHPYRVIRYDGDGTVLSIKDYALLAGALLAAQREDAPAIKIWDRIENETVYTKEGLVQRFYGRCAAYGLRPAKLEKKP